MCSWGLERERERERMELEGLLLISVVSIVVLLAIVRKKKKKGEGVPAPGPRGLPIIGHLHLLGRLPHQDLFKLSKDMYLGGTDTSAVVVEWALAELLLNPQKMEAIQAEMDEVVGKERMVQESDLTNLPYLDACIKETLRLHPPGPLLLPHKSLSPCEIGGFEVPAQSLTFINSWAIGRDPNVWDNPLDFCPERFLDTTINYMQGNCFHFLPFGSGRRACPGWRLGLLNVQIILASLLHGFEWAATDNLDLLESFNVVLAKATPLAAFAIPRLPRHLY